MKTIDFGKQVRINNLQNWIYDRYNNHSEVYLKAMKQHNIESQKK